MERVLVRMTASQWSERSWNGVDAPSESVQDGSARGFVVVAKLNETIGTSHTGIVNVKKDAPEVVSSFRETVEAERFVVPVEVEFRLREMRITSLDSRGCIGKRCMLVWIR